VSVSNTLDEDLYSTLLLNLTDTLSNEWHTFQRKRFLNLGIQITHLYCVVINNITLNFAAKLDLQLQLQNYYVGAAKIDCSNPLHAVLFDEYLVRSIHFTKNEILYTNVIDVINWEGYFQNHNLRYVEELFFECASPKDWVGNLSISGMDSTKIIKNKLGEYHHEKVGDAIITATLEGRIDRKFKLDINYPNAETAIVIPQKKLENYALDITHPVGGPKAQYFKDVLAINQVDWRYMEEQIRLGIHEGEVCNIKIDEHGIKYYVDIGIIGLNGVKKAVKTAWIIRPNEAIQLTTLYPLDLKEQFEVNYDVRPLLTLSKENEAEDKWGEVYRLANQSGQLLASKCIPTPVFIKGVAEPMREGLYGWAYVVFSDLNHEFVTWLKNNRLGHFYEDSYLLNIDIKGRYEQSVAFAEGICKVLRANKIDCEIQMHLD
jgi:hypothetical protein